MSVADPNNELYYVNATIGNNNYPVKFVVDSGTTVSTLSPSTVKKSGLNIDSMIKGYVRVSNTSGVINTPIIDLRTSIDGSTPMTVEYLIVPGNQDLMALSDIEKVFNITVSEGTLRLTPLSRPFKAIPVKKSRLGWSSGWI